MKTRIKDGDIVDGWKVLDLPIPYTEADYEEARHEILKQVKNTPEMSALFEYGYIPALGISDMDFWAVFPDDAEKMYIATEPPVSQKTRHVMMHHITLIAEKHYRKMLYFDPWTTNIWPDGQKLLYKKEGIERDLNFERLTFTKEEYQALTVLYIEEFLISIFSTIPLYAKKELPVRRIFENIKSCIYIMREMEQLTDKKIISDFPEEFQSLRSGWFQNDEEENIRRVIALFHKALLLGYEISFALGEWILEHSAWEPAKALGIQSARILGKEGRHICVRTLRERRVYTDSVHSPEEALERSTKSFRTFKLSIGPKSRTVEFYINFLPFGMTPLYLGLVAVGGFLSDHLKKDTFTNLTKVPVFKALAAEEKYNYINEITEIYNRKQVPGTNGKGWLFANNRFGYTFGGGRLRDKLLPWWVKKRFWHLVRKTGNLR